jgi:hypothetical protein
MSATQPALLTFDEFPKDVRLTDCLRQVEVTATCIPMTRALAKNKIDPTWWNGIGRDRKREEPDCNWSWATLYGQVKADANHYGYGWVVQTPDGEAQGAILYSVNALSLIEKDDGGQAKPAVFINYLASGPRNRVHLTEPLNGRYRGAGNALVKLTIAHSYYLGYSGRVNLMCVDDPRTRAWYENFGFVLTHTWRDATIFFELPEGQAAHYLASMVD